MIIQTLTESRPQLIQIEEGYYKVFYCTRFRGWLWDDGENRWECQKDIPHSDILSFATKEEAINELLF